MSTYLRGHSYGAIGLLLLVTIGLPRITSSQRVFESGQLPNIHGDVQGETINAASVSPWEIARLVNRNRIREKERHITPAADLAVIWRRLGIQPGSFDVCAGDCNVETYKSELDGQAGQEVLIKLTRSFSACRFLVFTEGLPDKSQWIFRGYIDHDFNRYQMARHRVIRFNGRPWLVIRGQEGSGSGFSLYGETWYEVGPHVLRAVLWYPSEGHTYPWPAGLGREFKAHVATNTQRQLIVNYEVSYTVLNYRGAKSSKFFVNHHRACYTWDAKLEFTFSNSCADISPSEIAAIANIESEEEEVEQTQQIGGTTFYSADQTRAFVGGGYEVFLKYNFPRLREITKDKSNALREWLRLFLADCQDTAEKRTLMSNLSKE